jgi:multiple sugar transport system permease protein
MAIASARDPRATTGIGARSEALAGYAFIAIPMLLFLVLNIGAILYSLYISVFQWNIRTGAGPFIGIANFQNVFKDPIFIRAIQNSLYYAVVWVPLTMAIGLFLAVLVNQKLRGRTFFRAAFYFPAIASSARPSPSIRSSDCSATPTTRTGSATRTRPSTPWSS